MISRHEKIKFASLKVLQNDTTVLQIVECARIFQTLRHLLTRCMIVHIFLNASYHSDAERL